MPTLSQRDVDAMAAEVVLLVKSALAPVLERLAVAETRLAEADKFAARLEGSTSVLQSVTAELSQRVAVVETRPPQPGPAGKDGEPGPPGKDGAPGLKFVGVYSNERTYDHGDIVKWGGSTYHCLKTTTGVKPDAVAPHSSGPSGLEFRGVNGKDFWELFVSKGDPGRAAK